MIPMDIINIYENYNYYFSKDYKAIFELCSKIAMKNSFKIYLIGGIVRDMLLNVNSLDIDITVEGDAVKFAHVLKKETDAKILSIHESFGTAKIEIQGKEIDLASTRSETYPQKGHLPKVEKIGCSLKKDIQRRDFTVNALAMSLNQENYGDLIDFTNGYQDLKNKKIRILHDSSFIDDPTRIIRAFKYANRLNFTLEETTAKLQEQYLKNVNYNLGIKRVKQEFKKTFLNADSKLFKSFIKNKIHKLITNNYSLLLTMNIDDMIDKYKTKQPWFIYFALIILNDDVEKYNLTKHEKNIVENVKILFKQTLDNDFDLYKNYKDKNIETLMILAALGRKKQVLNYLENLKKIKLHISGNDILKLEIKPSKLYSEGFDYVLAEKIKNPKLKKSEEIELFKKYLHLKK